MIGRLKLLLVECVCVRGFQSRDTPVARQRTCVGASAAEGLFSSGLVVKVRDRSEEETAAW